MANRLISIDTNKARGSRITTPLVVDELDAVVASDVNSVSTSTRGALDGRYRTVFVDDIPGCVGTTVGTGVDDSGEEPVSVTDESVATLVQTTGTATRAALDDLYSDAAVLSDADVASLVGNGASDTHSALVTLIGSTAGGVADDTDVAALVTSASATQSALDARYALPAELTPKTLPTATAHADAGTGAQVIVGGTGIGFRAVITTGTAPNSGGILATFALTGYTLPPIAFANPRDWTSAQIGIFCNTDGSTLYLVAAGELEPYQAYSFDILVLGV